MVKKEANEQERLHAVRVGSRPSKKKKIKTKTASHGAAAVKRNDERLANKLAKEWKFADSELALFFVSLATALPRRCST